VFPLTSADYRRLADHNRKAAQHMSMREAREELLAAAARLDTLAEDLDSRAARRALQAEAPGPPVAASRTSSDT
jgi:hypothetical protein